MERLVLHFYTSFVPWNAVDQALVSVISCQGLLVCTGLYGGGRVRYKGVEFPYWSEVLGWCLALTPALWLPGTAIWALAHKAGTFTEVRVKGGLILIIIGCSSGR